MALGVIALALARALLARSAACRSFESLAAAECTAGWTPADAVDALLPGVGAEGVAADGVATPRPREDEPLAPAE